MADKTITGPPRAVLYLRLSVSADDSTSIARQEADLRALAAREGWEIVAVLTDDGISGRREREKATAAVRMLKDGAADVLAVWKLDRFSRGGISAIGDLLDALEAREAAAKQGGRPVRFVALQDGLDSAHGVAFRLVASVLAEVARGESINLSTRQASAIKYRAENNKYTGGNSVPFGYRSIDAPDGIGKVLVLSKYESKLVTELADRLLNGDETLSALARDMHARGVYTSRSPARRALLTKGQEAARGEDPGQWRAATIRNLLTSEHLCGRVIWHEEYIRTEDGLPATVWPPILDFSTIEEIRRRLRWTPPKAARKRLGWTPPPDQKKRPARRATRLLSGMIFCGTCGSKMYCTSSNGRPFYGCATAWNGGNCATAIRINAEGVENYVSDTFLSVAGEWREVAVRAPAENSRLNALGEIEAALKGATAALAEDTADVPALMERIAALKARRAELRAEPEPEPETQETGRTLREAWEADDSPTWRQSVLRWGIDSVEIHPSPTRGVSPIDPRRVQINWVS